MVKSIQKFFSACTTVDDLYNKECNDAPIPNPIQFLSENTPCINNILYIDRSIQTMDVNTCTYPQEGVKILTSNSNHSGKKINCKSTPQGGGYIFCTNFNQSQSRIRHYVRSPREGAVNLCINSDQSQSRSNSHNHERLPPEGAVNLCTDLNQPEPRKIFKVHPPREGANSLCQSESENRIYPSGKTFNHSIASCNKTQFLPVSNCTSKPSVPIRK